MSERARGSERLAHIGRLAGGLAHEIKNPLSTVSINLQLIEEEWRGDDSSKGRRLRSKIELLRKEVKRLEDILSDFLRFARGDDIEPTKTDVNQIVDEVVDFIAPEAQSQQIQIRKSYASGLPMCWIDAKLFKQALLNIIINAQQAMPDGGELMVRTSLQGHDVVIDITDTGAGIAPEHRDKVFHVYYSTKKGGTGLGLATVQRIVEDHDGEVRLQSEVGKGTNVSIRMPIADGPPPAPVKQLQDATNG